MASYTRIIYKSVCCLMSTLLWPQFYDEALEALNSYGLSYNMPLSDFCSAKCNK